MTRCTNLLIVLLALSLAVLPGCQSGPADTTGQKSDGFPAPSKDSVYRASMKALIQSGFVPDYDESSERVGVITTRWNVQLQPFSGAGRRDKATVTINEVPGHESYFRVETNVIREQNVNVKRPGEAIYAEWENPARMPELENLITRRIEMSFLPGNASEEWRGNRGFDDRSPRLRDLDPKEPEKKEGPFGLPPLELPDLGG